MSKGIGRKLSVGFSKEAVRGTAESSTTFWVPFEEVSADEKDERVTDEQSYGVQEDSTSQSIVKQWAEIQLKSHVSDSSFPLLLVSALGTVNSALHAGETSVYDHTITVAQTSQHQSLTTFLDDPLASADYKYALSVVESLELNYEAGKFIEYSAKLRAKKGAAATLTPSLTAENLFLPQHLTFKLATNQAGLAAAPATIIKGLKLKINENIEDDEVLGSMTPVDFLNRKFTIEGKLEAIWQNESDFKTFTLAGTQKAMRIDLKNTDITIGTAANPEIMIDLYKVMFHELTRPIKINDVIRQTLQFKAHYSISDAKMVNIVATNLKTS